MLYAMLDKLKKKKVYIFKQTCPSLPIPLFSNLQVTKIMLTGRLHLHNLAINFEQC